MERNSMNWNEFWITIIMIFLVTLAICLSGCRTIHEVEEKTVIKTDTLYKSLLVRDSIYLQDSVVVREKGDTVFSEKWHLKYVDRWRTDTLYQVKIDSVVVEIEREKQLSKMERIKFFMTDVGIALGIAVVIGLVVYVLKRMGW